MNSEQMTTAHSDVDLNDLNDWTVERPGIVYQACRSCDNRWYFERPFCPHCGTVEPGRLQASGRGTVYSLSTIHRAPSEALRPYAPYTIVLIDMDEGFRMMGHGAPDLKIGDTVRAGYRSLAGKLMPYFDRDHQ